MFERSTLKNVWNPTEEWYTGNAREGTEFAERREVRSARDGMDASRSLPVGSLKSRNRSLLVASSVALVPALPVLAGYKRAWSTVP